MSKFEFMTFGCSPGDNDMFVANAKKYTPGQMVEICKRECEHLFKKRGLREPDVPDVQTAHSAFRFGNPDYPDGCYTFAVKGENGAFPVYVIDFERLREA